MHRRGRKRVSQLPKSGIMIETGDEETMENRMDCPQCSGRIKVRGEKEYKNLMNRLSRAEGQVRGLKRMLETDAYCVDILNQVAAVKAALNSFSRELLEEHIKTCVTQDIEQGGEKGTVDELVKVMEKLMR